MKVLVLLSLVLVSLTSMARRHPHGYCDPKISPVCEKTFKKMIPKWSYDEAFELNQIERACAGNVEDHCIKFSAKYLSKWDTNNLFDLTSVTRSCSFADVPCMEFLVSKLSKIHYNSKEDMGRIAKACRRVELSCVKTNCKSKEYNCKRTEELFDAAKACYQRCDD